MPPSPLPLSKGRGGETGLTTVAQGDGNWGPPLLATPEELAKEEELLEGAEQGGWVEITLISCSTVDASTSTRDDRASNWELPPSTLPPTLVGAPAETFLTLEEVPAAGPLDLGLDLGLLPYDFVLEACSSQASHWDAFRGEQESRGTAFASNVRVHP